MSQSTLNTDSAAPAGLEIPAASPRAVGRKLWAGIAIVALGVVGGCSKQAGRHDKEPGPEPTAPERVVVPTGTANAGAGGISDPARAAGAHGGSGAAPGVAAAPADDARFHLRTEEGSLKVENAEGKVGAALVAKIIVTPAPGLHIATDFPIKLTLTGPSEVKLAKTEWTAGGGGKSVGDASELSEQRLAFAIAATAEKAGTYEITGVFKFGVCDKDSCHPKRQPIAISIAAN